MSDFKVELVFPFDAEVAESPAWSVEEQALYWADIHKCTLNRLDLRTQTNTAWDVPSMPGCFVFREGGAIIPARDGIYDFDLATERMTRVLDPPYDPATHRFNDGKCDRQGRLWVGTQPLEVAQFGSIKSHLYRYDGVTIEPVIEIDMANGLAFSPDGRTMYRAETPARIVYVYDFNTATGIPSRQRVFAEWARGFGAPDGATIDTQGGYWIALPAGEAGGGIGRFTPDGKLDFRIPMPLPTPSMCNFGGPDMKTLYVTTAQFKQLAGRPGYELAGNFYAIRTEFQGIPEPKFKRAA